MPIQIAHGTAVVLIRQEAFEKSGLLRTSIDERYNLTDLEFRVENGLVVVGPLASDDMLTTLIEDLEQNGLVYFEDFFDLSGNWPEWLALYARAIDRPKQN
jgi:Zn-finger domain-containing protein